MVLVAWVLTRLLSACGPGVVCVCAPPVKDNADKLDFKGADHKKMQEYRQQLDRDRAEHLARGVQRSKAAKAATEDSDDDGAAEKSDASAADSAR